MTSKELTMEEKDTKPVLRLIIDDSEIKEFPKLDSLKLNLNGHKPKGRNLYKKRLSEIRKLFR